MRRPAGLEGERHGDDGEQAAYEALPSSKIGPFLPGALWCGMVYDGHMAVSKTSVRQTVSLPSRVARRVHSLAKRQRTSASRVIVDLIETGLEAREQEKKQFFELADRLVQSSDTSEQKRLKAELAQLTFGK